MVESERKARLLFLMIYNKIWNKRFNEIICVMVFATTFTSWITLQERIIIKDRFLINNVSFSLN